MKTPTQKENSNDISANYDSLEKEIQDLADKQKDIELELDLKKIKRDSFKWEYATNKGLFKKVFWNLNYSSLKLVVDRKKTSNSVQDEMHTLFGADYHAAYEISKEIRLYFDDGEIEIVFLFPKIGLNFNKDWIYALNEIAKFIGSNGLNVSIKDALNKDVEKAKKELENLDSIKEVFVSNGLLR